MFARFGYRVGVTVTVTGGRVGANPIENVPETGPQQPAPPLAPELLGLVQHVTAYERLTVEAARTRDRVTARKALLAHPLIGQDELAGSLLDALLAEQTVSLAEVAR